MVSYQCMECRKSVEGALVKKRVRCPYCGNKILNKQRMLHVVVEAV